MKARCVALAPLLLASCMEYGAPDSVVYGEVVITHYASNVDWNAYQTYSIDPVVVVIDETGSVTDSCSVDGTQLVPTIKKQMDDRGYAQVDWSSTPGNAHLEIKMSAMLGSVVYYYPGYCGWYGYYCYPGWTYAGSYTFGTLVLDMGDMLHATSGGAIPLTWTAASYGILSSYYTGCSSSGNGVNWSRISDAIDRAFEQSPYINRTAP